MENDEYKESFQYFSVIVPTIYPVKGSSELDVPLGDHWEHHSANSYLRFGDTPTPEDLKGGEPGLAQRKHAVGKPAWETSELGRSFAPQGGEALRVDAGDAVDFGVEPGDPFYKNVGWLDHCNGHRVTTTHGDKVEVITGNYKLVVLGRGAKVENSTGFDMSGGHTVNWAKTPGCVRTITAEGDSFKVTHVTDEGHEYTIFQGFDTDHIVGGSTSISIMGGANELVKKEASGSMDLVVDQAWSKKVADGDYGDTIVDIDAGAPPQRDDWNFGEKNDLKSKGETLAWVPESFAEVDDLDAATRVVEGRRAQRYDEWVSVDDTFTEEVHAGQFKFVLDCKQGAFTEDITAKSMKNTVTVSGGEIQETWVCASYTEHFTGNRKNTTSATLETEHHYATNKFDLVVATVAWEDMSFGGIKLAVEGFVTNINMSGAALHIDTKAGALIEREPFKLEQSSTAFSQGVLRLEKWTALKLKQCGVEVNNANLNVVS